MLVVWNTWHVNVIGFANIWVMFDEESSKPSPLLLGSAPQLPPFMRGPNSSLGVGVLQVGYDAVLVSNIPGGGMSRSASLTLNLILTTLDVSSLTLQHPFQVCHFQFCVVIVQLFTAAICGVP